MCLIFRSDYCIGLQRNVGDSTNISQTDPTGEMLVSQWLQNSYEVTFIIDIMVL